MHIHTPFKVCIILSRLCTFFCWCKLKNCDFSFTTANCTAESQFCAVVETKWSLRAYRLEFCIEEAAALKRGILQPQTSYQSIHSRSSPGGWLHPQAAPQWFLTWWTTVVHEQLTELPTYATSPWWGLASTSGGSLACRALPSCTASAGSCTREESTVMEWVT